MSISIVSGFGEEIGRCVVSLLPTMSYYRQSTAHFRGVRGSEQPGSHPESNRNRCHKNKISLNFKINWAILRISKCIKTDAWFLIC